jgi:DNA polymerase (family X)
MITQLFLTAQFACSYDDHLFMSAKPITLSKDHIIQTIESIATLLELDGQNPFKVRAYHQAARTLETCGQDIGVLIENGKLGDLPGIGKTLLQTIEELYFGRPVPTYEDLKKRIAPGLIAMLDIPGMGTKKIRALHSALGIDSIESLKAACLEGKVDNIEGFGPKTVQNILKGIEQRVAYSARHLLAKVWSMANEIEKSLENAPGVTAASIAGSARRKLETIGDLDFVAAAKDSAPVMDWFLVQPWVSEILSHGPTKSSIRLADGMQADLRVVPPEQFAFALHHFTGSKDHNIQMRHRALQMKYSLSEWGMRAADRSGEYEAHGIQCEKDLFAFLKLSYIDPEMREGMGEIEMAEHGSMPKLIELKDLRGAFHNHTNASDGKNTLEEMAQAAEDLGWEYLGIADHSKSSHQANGLSPERLMEQIKQIHALNASKKFKIHLFTGTECDILPDGSLDFEDELLSKLDYVVASVHSSFTQDEATMTARLIKAIEHPLVTMLGHPSGRLLLRRPAYAVDMNKVIDAAIANKKIIELNASPERLDLDWRYWRKAADRGLMCSINPDAHATTSLRFVEYGIWMARKGGLTKEQVLGTRGLKDVQGYLKR